MLDVLWMLKDAQMDHMLAECPPHVHLPPALEGINFNQSKIKKALDSDSIPPANENKTIQSDWRAE